MQLCELAVRKVSLHSKTILIFDQLSFTLPRPSPRPSYLGAYLYRPIRKAFAAAAASCCWCCWRWCWWLWSWLPGTQLSHRRPHPNCHCVLPFHKLQLLCRYVTGCKQPSSERALMHTSSTRSLLMLRSSVNPGSWVQNDARSLAPYIALFKALRQRDKCFTNNRARSERWAVQFVRGY